MQLALQSWKISYTQANQRREVIIKIIKRQAVKKWKVLNDRKKSQEHISLQIIFNRWKYFTEEKIYKSKRQALALDHRIRYLSKQVLHSWMSIKTDSKDSLKYSRINMTRNAFSSERHLRNSNHTNIGHKLVDLKRYSTSRSPFLSKYSPNNATTCTPNRRILSEFGNDLVSRRLNFMEHDSKFLSTSRPHSLHGRSCVATPTRTRYEHRLHPFKFTNPDKMSLKYNSINRHTSKDERKLTSILRPVEQPMYGTSEVGQRRPHFSSWILNGLSNQGITHCSELKEKRRLQSIARNNEVIYPTAEPKDISGESSFAQLKSRKTQKLKHWLKESYCDLNEQK